MIHVQHHQFYRIICWLNDLQIRFTTNLYTGNVIVHCHILQHEDLGMMMLAKILPEDESEFNSIETTYSIKIIIEQSTVLKSIVEIISPICI